MGNRNGKVGIIQSDNLAIDNNNLYMMSAIHSSAAYENVALDYNGPVYPLRIKFHHDSQATEMFHSKGSSIDNDFGIISETKPTNGHKYGVDGSLTKKSTNGFILVEPQPSNKKDVNNKHKQRITIDDVIASLFGTTAEKGVTKKQIVDKIIALPFSDKCHLSHQEGPDYIIPAENFHTSDMEGVVKLRTSVYGPASMKPISVVSFLEKTVKNFPNHNALAVKRKGEWIHWTYTQYWNDIRTAAKGFIKLGLEPHKSVGILGFNAPEWFITELGTIFAGGMACGIYTTNSPEACYHVLQDSGASIIVVENEIQLKKIMQIRSKLTYLKAIIQYIGEPTTPGVLSWKDLMDIGYSVEDEILERRIKNLAINQCCSLIYTSGTTGNAKGVMLSHDNLTHLAALPQQIWEANVGEEVFLSYLPLSHIAAQICDMFISTAVAAEVYFAPPEALKGSLVDTLKEVHPTRLFGVPRVWEKMAEKLKEAEQRMSPFKKAVFSWSRSLASRYNKNRINGSTSVPFLFSFANKFFLKKVRQALGLDKTLTLLSGAAPITYETLEYFSSLNMMICELFGMSESCGPHTFNFDDKYKMGSVGLCFPGFSAKIDNPDEKGNGELCLYGRNVFMGYLNSEEKTKEVFDDECWLHTGDIARIDNNHFVFITGRIKELLITAGGENVAPVPIEENVKSELPIVSNCMLIGDKCKFLSLLITLKTETDLNTLMPREKLLPTAKDWCKSVGSNADTVTDILNGPDQKIMSAIQSGIDRANSKAVSNAQRIQKWIILPQDFSIPGGELGPTLKLKRPVVLKKYQSEISKLYEGC